jgi:type I restriction enzyme R subunit
MTTQPEQILEDNLVKQLTELGYTYVKIKDEKDLLANLKTQLENHNNTTFTEKEFARVLNHLDKGNVFQRAGILRDKMQLKKDNGENIYIEFLQQEHWCQNHFQVTRQITMEGTYKNRYDVTLLVNGLPLVQIELKRRGLELKEAFNQTNRYQRHSYWSGSGLFQYIQIFVISNGVNTKYYANNNKQSFKQTFFRTDNNNKAVTQLETFTREFLEPCHISKMITKYIVLNQARKILMVLRSYQYYAVEALIHRVENSRKNGYIWHTTGSGKTLTSFKASQILIRNPKIDKVVFVVDRKDLDYQTQKEFDAFSKGSVDATENTRMLIKQFGDHTNRLILTTIQKLNNAIYHKRFLKKMEPQKDREIIFIFDECHRSQFGETHKRIKIFFTNARMYGFTGTPIFAENAVKNDLGKRTTKELFHQCLHKYVITDAIRDENVLKFAVEYIGKYKEKQGSKTGLDIEVEDIDTKELLDSTDRLGKITDYIIANHNRKTHSRDFTAMFCVSSIDTLIKYYQLFKERQKKGAHNLKIATIFSYTANEEDKDADGLDLEHLSWPSPHVDKKYWLMAAEPSVTYNVDTGPTDNLIPLHNTPHSRDQLESFIHDYNTMFNTKFTTKDSLSFYNYYQDIGKRVKNRQIDILLVVNMFLTGFDSTTLNTLYVDKNLKYHGLIQAYSRTNRILNDKKSHGNIVCFRNLKKATDDAITLFANKEAEEIIIMGPYEDYVQKFNNAFAALLTVTPTVTSVDDLEDERKELEFIKAFRDLMRLKNQLSTFVDFTWEHLDMAEQLFENYKSKYLDLYEKVKNRTGKEKVSILDDVDFELELIHRDEINVQYILRLLAKLKETPAPDRETGKKQIVELLAGQVGLRSKRELIEKFIEENLMHIADIDDIPDEFNRFWTIEKDRAFTTMCIEENLSREKCRNVLDNYLYTSREPLRDDVLDMLLGKKPGVRERKRVAQRIISKLTGFVETFINGIDI